MNKINSKYQAAVLEVAQKLSPDREHDAAVIAALIEKIDIEKVVCDMVVMIANAGDDVKIKESSPHLLSIFIELLSKDVVTFIEQMPEEDGEYVGILCALLFHIAEQLLFQDTNE